MHQPLENINEETPQPAIRKDSAEVAQPNVSGQLRMRSNVEKKQYKRKRDDLVEVPQFVENLVTKEEPPSTYQDFTPEVFSQVNISNECGQSKMANQLQENETHERFQILPSCSDIQEESRHKREQMLEKIRIEKQIDEIDATTAMRICEPLLDIVLRSSPNDEVLRKKLKALSIQLRYCPSNVQQSSDLSKRCRELEQQIDLVKNQDTLNMQQYQRGLLKILDVHKTNEIMAMAIEFKQDQKRANKSFERLQNKMNMLVTDVVKNIK